MVRTKSGRKSLRFGHDPKECHLFNIFSSMKRKVRKEPKVFIIGFNKCGTKTLHRFFEKNGVASAHCNYFPRGPEKRKTRLAKTMRDNVEGGRPILYGLEHYQVFSDLVALSDQELIEANRYFKQMRNEHPDAFFIFNDRPVEDWIKSRVGHEGGPSGSFIGRSASALGVSIEKVPDIWRQQYADHKQSVLRYFEGHDRFLHFELGKDGPEQLIEFFDNALPLDLRKWRHAGSAEDRKRKQEIRAMQSGDSPV
jgi:hypothetical protein